METLQQVQYLTPLLLLLGLKDLGFCYFPKGVFVWAMTVGA